MPAIDSAGTVYITAKTATYTLSPSPANVGPGVIITGPAGRIFLKQAIGAAHTPLSIGPDGKFYPQNDGHLFVVDN